jgi:hypothetical protein
LIKNITNGTATSISNLLDYFFFVLLKGIIDVFSKSKIKKEAGIKQLIAAVVMLIVGVGVCGYLLSGIGGMH